MNKTIRELIDELRAIGAALGFDTAIIDAAMSEQLIASVKARAEKIKAQTPPLK